jgi:transposase-like protein
MSRITELVLERVESFRTRPLRKRYAIVYLECLFAKVLREEGIRKEAVYVVLGGGAGLLFVFFRYPKALWTYLRSTNRLEQSIRELHGGTKMWDHKFPKAEAIDKLFLPRM